MNGVTAVIFDWAGTTVDYGCFAPVKAFEEAFADKGISVSTAEIRQFMGLPKKEHVRRLCALDTVKNQAPQITDELVNAIYEGFETCLMKELANYCEPVPGILDVIKYLRRQNIKIGSTTGYTAAMMEIVTSEAAKKGYAPDAAVTPDGLPQGRPAPYMCYMNAIELNCYPLSSMIKVGDTLADIEEGLQAGMWTVGVVEGGSELGLSLAEVTRLTPEEKHLLTKATKDRFQKAGAHFIADTIIDVIKITDEVEKKLALGEKPRS